MPEGHTIHALAERVRRAFGGRPVAACSPQGRFAEAARLDGARVLDARAYGKHLFVDVEAEILHVHLGLIGSFPVLPLAGAPAAPPVGRVRLRLVGDDHVADLRGPLICALTTPEHRDAVVAALGPDPLDPNAAEGRGWDRLRRSRRTVAELLLDQGVAAGLGNVYRCEVLHRHRLDPYSPGSALTRASWEALWTDLVRLLPLGVAFGQIVTMPDDIVEAERLLARDAVSDYTASLTGERLGDYFERRFAVYQRAGEACPRCGHAIRADKVGGRTLYWCPSCQDRH